MKKGYLIAIASLLTASCGGGGGDSTPAIPLDTSTIRSYVEGDSLEAVVTAREISSGQEATGNVTVTVGGVVSNPFGMDCRLVTYSVTLTAGSVTVPYLVRELFYQDVDGSMYACGEYSDDLGRYVFLTNTATSPNGVFLVRESPMQVGNATTGIIYLDDGSWADCTEIVVAIANVSVPLGKYEAYKSNQSCSYSDGSVIASTVWTVPSIFNLKESAVSEGISLVLEVISEDLQ